MSTGYGWRQRFVRMALRSKALEKSAKDCICKGVSSEQTRIMFFHCTSSEATWATLGSSTGHFEGQQKQEIIGKVIPKVLLVNKVAMAWRSLDVM